MQITTKNLLLGWVFQNDVLVVDVFFFFLKLVVDVLIKRARGKRLSRQSNIQDSHT